MGFRRSILFQFAQKTSHLSMQLFSNLNICLLFSWWLPLSICSSRVYVISGATASDRAHYLQGPFPVPHTSIILEWDQPTKIGLQCRAYSWWIWWKTSGGAWLHLGITFKLFITFVGHPLSICVYILLWFYWIFRNSSTDIINASSSYSVMHL